MVARMSCMQHDIEGRNKKSFFGAKYKFNLFFEIQTREYVNDLYIPS